METLCLHKTFAPVLTSLVQEDNLHATKRAVQTPNQPQTFSSTKVSCLQNTLGQWWHRACENNQPISDMTEGPFHEMEPTPNTACMTKNKTLRVDSPEPRVKSNTTALLSHRQKGFLLQQMETSTETMARHYAQSKRPWRTPS